MVLMVESVIFTEGFDAWQHGIPRGANPCRHDPDAWTVWWAGWDAAAEATASNQGTKAPDYRPSQD